MLTPNDLRMNRQSEVDRRVNVILARVDAQLQAQYTLSELNDPPTVLLFNPQPGPGENHELTPRILAGVQTALEAAGYIVTYNSGPKTFTLEVPPA